MNCEQFPFSADYTEVQLNALKEIWRTKEYRLFPTSVFSHIRNDENLQEGAIICWITLFELSYFDKDWCIQISHKELSKYLGNKSERTIYRWLKQLTSFGYLEMYKSRGEIATYAVRFPAEAVLDILKNTPDRKYSSTSQPIKKQFSEIKSQNCVRSVEKDKPDKNSIPNSLGKIGEVSTNKVCDKNVSTPMTNLTKSQDKSDTYSLYNNINTNINITSGKTDPSNVVVDPEIIESEKNINALQQQLEEIEKNIHDVNQSLTKTLTPQQRMKNLEFYRKLDDRRFYIKNAMDLKKRIKEENLQNKLVLQTLQEKPKHFVEQLGLRPISEFQYHRLRKSLGDIGIPNEKINQITNEVIFEIRFGSLKKCYKTQVEMSIDHAINVALKILREGRWEQPHGLVENIRGELEAHHATR